ncbi:hypothetical protein RI367_005560 [Sorochytrium milnesiophthora]
MNLDPHKQHDDAALWRALEQAGLKETMASLTGGLDAAFATGGSSFSAGQRQLMALASAASPQAGHFLFCLIDTISATDAETDATVQCTIRTESKDCAVSTITHCIVAMADSGRILVLDQGQVFEFDTPRRLLADSGTARFCPTGQPVRIFGRARQNAVEHKAFVTSLSDWARDMQAADEKLQSSASIPATFSVAPI